jgi:hypothetical protein
MKKWMMTMRDGEWGREKGIEGEREREKDGLNESCEKGG